MTTVTGHTPPAEVPASIIIKGLRSPADVQTAWEVVLEWWKEYGPEGAGVPTPEVIGPPSATSIVTTPPGREPMTPLNIVTAGAPRTVTRSVTCIYGDKGAGKTTLALSAERPLLLDFDNGSHRALREAAGRSERPTWDDVAHFDASDLQPYQTVVVDTAGRMVRSMRASVLAADYKLRTKWNTPTIAGWQAIAEAFADWLVKLRECDVDIILLAHAKEVERGEQGFYRLDVPSAGCRQEIYYEADLMGFMSMGDNNTRIVDFSPTVFHHGSNPLGWHPISVPVQQPGSTDDTMARLLADYKAHVSRVPDTPRATRAPAAQPAQPAAPATPAATGAPQASQEPAPDSPAAQHPTEPAAPAQGHSPAYNEALLNQVNADLALLQAKYPKQEDGRPEKSALWDKAAELGFAFDTSTGQFAVAQVTA